MCPCVSCDLNLGKPTMKCEMLERRLSLFDQLDNEESRRGHFQIRQKKILSENNFHPLPANLSKFDYFWQFLRSNLSFGLFGLILATDRFGEQWLKQGTHALRPPRRGTNLRRRSHTAQLRTTSPWRTSSRSARRPRWSKTVRSAIFNPACILIWGTWTGPSWWGRPWLQRRTTRPSCSSPTN